MDNIKTIYVDYDDIINKFGEDRIKGRFKFFIKTMEEFIERLGDDFQDKLAINDSVLRYCVMDYFSDIYRLKEFHDIGKINDIKRIAYESQWILRRKPIQILSDDICDERLVYANEKFVLTYLLHELLGNRENDILTEKAVGVYRGFVNSLFYHLKYRNCDAKVLELMILAFKAGLNYNINSDE